MVLLAMLPQRTCLLGVPSAPLLPLGPAQAQTMSVLVIETVIMAISSSRLMPAVSNRLLALRSQ